MWEYEEMVALAAPGTVLAEFRDSGVAQMIRVTSYNRCARPPRIALMRTACTVFVMPTAGPHRAAPR